MVTLRHVSVTTLPWKSSITHSECVSVDLLIQKEKHMRHILICVLSGSTLYFFSPTLSHKSGFDGLGVACWPLVPKFVGSNPTEAIGFLGRKNIQRAFLQKGSKAVGPMS